MLNQVVDSPHPVSDCVYVDNLRAEDNQLPVVSANGVIAGLEERSQPQSRGMGNCDDNFCFNGQQ